jgi:hypothetical protein
VLYCCHLDYLMVLLCACVELGFRRVSYSAAEETYANYTSAAKSDISRAFFEYSTDCMQREFNRVDSSGESGIAGGGVVSRMLRCWRGAAVEKKPFSRKCAEVSMGGVCPFNGVHSVCLR